ncbi:MAG: hypothetical protein A2286_06920 [Gammaproteobacteria bacterium RIFOXYA12_FULL_61_12]|nr:MAG: hypothetical protein A2514_13295 [Gammaproteobacteria bacterium RIFOXYD12_FULL_61_37]OGT93125.1 MAG: hypothetical protein A2286_06920 [Gammaproteobacteria bacterium RIFOXYA12_FULL_61_12]
MDINVFHAWYTIVLMIVFFGIIWWTFSRKRKSSFNEAANLPFDDENRHEATLQKDSNHE